MIQGVDYTDPVTPAGAAALKAAGKEYACRYGGPGGRWKMLTAAERDALHGAGLGIVANAEGTEDGLLGGWDAGVSWARQALSHFGALGLPPDRPVYFSVDFDCDGDKQWAAVANGLRGAASVLGLSRIGVYGKYDVMRWARRDGVTRWFWQTYAWSGGRWATGNHIEQYRNNVTVAGASVDLDRALVADYGQWIGGDMTITDADADLVASKVWYRPVNADAGEAQVMAWVTLDETHDAALSTDKRIAALEEAVKTLEDKLDQVLELLKTSGTAGTLPITGGSITFAAPPATS